MPEVPSCWRPPGQRSPIAPPRGQTLPEFRQWRLPVGIRVPGTCLVFTSSTVAVGLSVPGAPGDSGTPWSRVPRAPRPARLGGRELGRRGRVGPGAEASPRPAPLAAGPGGRKGPKRGPTPRLPEPIAGSAERK